MSWRRTVKTGDPFVWLTGAALGVSLVMVIGLLLLIVTQAASVFWPAPLVQLQSTKGETILGAMRDRDVSPDNPNQVRLQFQVGNRDVYGADFRWLIEDEIGSTSLPEAAVSVERREWGNFYGFLKSYRGSDRVFDDPQAAWDAVERDLPVARDLAEQIRQLETFDIVHVSEDIEKRRRAPEPDNAELESLQARSTELHAQLEKLLAQSEQQRLTLVTVDGQEKELPLREVVRIYQPNRIGLGGKLALYAEKLWEFLTASPRESNTEGGIFPALFGTVMMVMIMTIAVVPFGVLAALYLREYAHQGVLVRLVRIAVNNLAGVPSIVFGVFGLGFFVYFLGGSIDSLLFADRLPTPTFGTGGILWASLTLALLTVPVVVVATEEALAAVPREHREASIALGATKFETIWRVVLPNSLPGILTGLILAMARAAGEVAPLMITGVVKLAPTMPFDMTPPFLHLDRKFMHLGFHIYDVGFQSPNVEAAKPMVYATTLLLVAIVIVLNLGAIVVRNKLRQRYAGSTF